MATSSLLKGQSTVNSQRNGTVVLFGEVLADIFPDRQVLGGAPFNVARHLKAFRHNPVLLTRLGHDSLREEILSVMTANNMETLGVQCTKSYPTGRVQVHLENGHHRFEILPLQAYDFIHPALVRMATLSAHPVMVYFGTLAQRHDISRRALKNLMRSTCATRFLDINLRAPWYDADTLGQSLQYADIVKLNEEELAVLAEMFKLNGRKPQQQAHDLLKKFELAQAIVTCGEAGSWQIGTNGKRVDAAATKTITKVVDTVGAGDGYAAVCIAGSLRQWPVGMTLERANTFAAAICELRGAVPDHADFYEPFIREWGI